MNYIGSNNVRQTKIYYFYTGFIYSIVYIYFPLSLILGIFSLVGSVQDFMENLALIMTVIVCSIKIAMYHWKLGCIRRIGKLFDQLDQSLSEQEYLQLVKRGKKAYQPVLYLYASVFLSSILAILFFQERRLVYPAWFPFDWMNNDFTYVALILYQIYGIGVLIIANFVSDSLPTVFVSMLTAQLELLCQRVASVGWNIKNSDHSLSECIRDHKIVLEIHRLVGITTTVQLFLQFTVSGLTICSTIVLLSFFVKDIIQRIYFTLYLMSILSQVFIVCYHGSSFAAKINSLTIEIYSCNWMGQSESFKRSLIIFSERSLRTTQFSAGGFFYITLNTFAAIVKSAYSYYAMLSRAANKM